MQVVEKRTCKETKAGRVGGPGRREGRQFSWIEVRRCWKNLEQVRVVGVGWAGGHGRR